MDENVSILKESREGQIPQPYKNKLRYLQGLLIALIISGFEAFSFISSSLGTNSRSASIIYRMIFVVICLSVIRRSVLEKRLFSKSPLIFVIMFWSLYLLRAVYDSFINPNVEQSYVSLYWNFAFFLCFIPMISTSALINHKTLIASKKMLLGLSLFVNTLSITGNLMNVAKNLQTRYNANEVINSITYGQSGLVLLILSFSYFVNEKTKYKYLYLAFMALGVANIAVAASRGPVLQLGVVFGFYLAANTERFRLKSLIIPAALLVIFIHYSQQIINFSNVIVRLLNSSVEEERTVLFLESWQRFCDNPVFGSRAIGEFAHNIFIGSLEALGVLGGILVGIIYLYLIRSAYELAKFETTNWLALLLIMYLVDALFSGAVWNLTTLWPLVGLILNLYLNRSLYHPSMS